MVSYEVMKGRIYFGFVIALAALAAAPGLEAKKKNKQAEPAPEIVFPAPPAEPRVKYLYSIARMDDVRKKKPSALKQFIMDIFGKKGPQGYLLAKPYSLCARGETIYVADTQAGAVVVIDQAREQVWRIGGTLKGRLVSPIGVAVNASGTVYVSDSYLNVVKAFGPDGKYLFEFGPVEKLVRPTGLAYDLDQDRIFVADTGNSRILAYDSAGSFQFEFGKKGREEGDLGTPVNLALDQYGCVLVSDMIRCKVSIYSPAGDYLSGFGEPGDSPGYLSRPRGIALDSDGNIYVADALFNAIQIFDREGKLLLIFGAGGSEPGAFTLPAGLFMDAQDRLYVVDSLNRRVQVFQYLKAASAQE